MKSKESKHSKRVADDDAKVEAKRAKKTEEGDSAEPELTFDYDELVQRASAIAQPMAPKKLTSKLLKTTKKAAKAKRLRRGVKEVTKSVRKQEKGVVLIAGDISPIDVISHLPILCEENEIPYCYVPCKLQLGVAANTKRATSCLLFQSDESYAKAYAELVEAVQKLPHP